jgi:hypothetical protein
MEEYEEVQGEWHKKIMLFESGSLKWVVMVAETSLENTGTSS